MNQSNNTCQTLESSAEKPAVETRLKQVEPMASLAAGRKRTNLKDWTGIRQGRWTIKSLNERGSHKKSANWICECDCGNIKIVSSECLRGGTQSCGCLTIEKRKERTKRSKSNTRTYKSWSTMLQRCNNPKNPKYHRYGGRGITVCFEWKSSENFLRDMGECPKGHTIDRIDNNGNYCKENCRWADIQTQARNRSNNRMIEINGEVKTMTEWCEIYNISNVVVRMRIHRGMDPVMALQKKVRTWD